MINSDKTKDITSWQPAKKTGTIEKYGKSYTLDNTNIICDYPFIN